MVEAGKPPEAEIAKESFSAVAGASAALEIEEELGSDKRCETLKVSE